MGRFALLGMGWHSWLFREEMRAIVGEVDLLHPRVVSCKIEAETLGRLSGSLFWMKYLSLEDVMS